MSVLDVKKRRAKAAKEAARSPTESTDQASTALAAFKARATEETKRRDDATDSEHWFATCFHSRADKEKFLRDHGLAELGDKYLDGYAVADALAQR